MDGVKDINKNFNVGNNLTVSEDKFRLIIEKTSDLIFITTLSLDPVSTYVNPSIKKNFNYYPEEIIGKFLSDFIHPEDLKQLQTFLEKYDLENKNEFSDIIQFRFIDKSGNWHFLESTVNLIGEGFLFISKDITKHKKEEEKLEIKSQQLEEMNRELFVLREQLSDINENLEIKVQERTEQVLKLLKQKDLFITQLDHDLKTPLTPLINLFPLLEKKINNDSESIKLFNILKTSVNRLYSVIMKTSRYVFYNAPSTRIFLEKLDIYNIIEDVIKQLDIDNSNIKIENNTNNLKDFYADKIMITELFENLLDNAVNFSNEKDLITIDFKKSKEYILISIKDNGIGMNDKQLSLIFDPFYKADESRHVLEHHGLGLSICKLIIEKHNGKIWAESEGIGKGSTFYFSLPVHID